MKNYKSYTVIMERMQNGQKVHEQVRAYSVCGIRQCVRAYMMANRGWYIADLPYNERVRSVLNREV